MFESLNISKKSIISTLVIILCVCIMVLMFSTLKEAGRTFDNFNLYRYIFVLLTFFIGVFIEFERLLNAVKRGVEIKPLALVISILILIFLFIPVGFGMSLTGFGPDAILMQEAYFRSILGLIAGVLFVRAL